MIHKLNHDIKILALGGSGDFGKNLYVVEIDEKIYVVDVGIMYPENEMLGVDYVIPDMTYLFENKDRVKAIFLSHGHEDHIGALPFLLKEISAPVYGSELTIELAKSAVASVDRKIKARFRVVHSNSVIKLNGLKVTFFATNHSIPGSLGISIGTVDGAIVYTGDYKFDQSAHFLYQAEIGKMAMLGDKGVLALLSESKGSETPGFTPSEYNCVSKMEDVFTHAKGRIFVASFASNLSVLQNIFNAARNADKKVAILGKSIEKVYQIAINHGFLEVDDDVIISINEALKLDSEEVVILTTGDQGEPFHVLQRMARGFHRRVNITSEDTVVIAASPLASHELLLTKTLDILSKLGTSVVHGKNELYVSGNGSQEELKMMINLMKPKYLFPVGGDYRRLVGHAKLAMSLGMHEFDIAIMENGQVFEISEHGPMYSSKVKSGNILIDGIGVGDVGSIVLRDRKVLSEDGALVVTASISRRQKKIISNIEIESRGFVFVRDSGEMMDRAKEITQEVILKNISKDTFDWNEMKQEIRDRLYQYFFEKTKRRPLILPVVMEVR